MPKRKHNDDSFQYLADKIKKLEKRLKVSNRHRQRSLSESDDDSNSSKSASTASSRDSSPSAPPYSPLSDRDHNEQPPATTTEQATTPLVSVPEPLVPGPAAPPQSVIDEPAIVEKHDDVTEIPPTTSEPGLDPDILDILGTDPSRVEEFGPNINDELASRLSFIATHGLEKENRKQLLQKYPTPSNCKDLSAPIINAEIKAAIPEYVLKRDKSIEINQKQIAAAITGVGRIISTQISCSDRDNELLKNLMDVNRILCDVQYLQSNARRNYALNSLKKDLKEQLNSTKIDGFLFGKDLAETLKSAKAVSRSSTDLKPDVARKTKQARNLNRKSGPGSRRAAPGPQRHQPPTTTRPMMNYQPAPPPPPPASSTRGQSSATSSYRPRQTRRR